MNLPITPPTDNLYKFLAIAGVVLMVVAVIFIKREDAEAFEVLVEQYPRLTEQQVVLLDLAKELEQLTKEAKAATTPEQREEYESRLDEFKPRYDQTVRAFEQDPGIFRLNTALMKHKGARKDGWVLMGAGGVIAGLGFGLWYRKGQKLQDELLALQVKQEREKKPGIPAAD